MRKTLFMAILALLMGTSCTIAENENSNTDKYDSQLLPQGTEAADFNIVNDQYPGGMKLSSFRGKYVVLDFWASWCPDCRKDIPSMVELYKKYSPKGVIFIGVSFDTNKKTWQKCIKDNGMGWIQYSELKKWKKETTVDVAYKVNWIPTTYLIDREGKVVMGTIDINKLSRALENIK